MKTITMYELLGLVKDGKAPKKIKYNDKIWRLASDGTYFIGSDYGYDFWVEHGDDKFEDESITLNDEVEIIEEKEMPEKEDELIRYNIKEFDNLKEFVEITTNDVFGKVNKVIDKLNGVIDYLKSKGD